MKAYFSFFNRAIVFPLHCFPLPIIQAAIDKDTHAYYNCTRNNTSATRSVYNSNIKTLLNWLSSNSTNNARYYNTTVTGQNTVDTVYGIFQCKRSISSESCQVCVKKAAKLILSLCNTSKEAIVWYNVCFVRYSDRHFFSTMEESPEISFMNDKDYVGEVGHYSIIVWDMLNDLRNEAANASTKYAEKSVNITDNEKLYGSVWCIQYLSTENCSLCISDAIADVQTSCCRGKNGGTILYPSCAVRFELYPFLNAQPPPPPPLLPMSPRPSATPGLS